MSEKEESNNFRFVDIRKMLTTFVENEIGTTSNGETASKDSTHKRTTGVVVVKSEKLSRVVSRGIAIKRIITSMNADLAKIDKILKKFGQDKIDELKKEGNDVKSIRFSSTNDDLSILVTNRKASPDGRSAAAVKKLLGRKRFSEVFDEKTTWTLNDSFVKQCFTTLSAAFGKSYLEKAFSKKTSFSVKKGELDTLLSEELDDETRNALNKFVKPSDPAITYPK